MHSDHLGDLHLKRLEAQNVKGISLVVIEPNGPGLILISGANGSGKSSTIDSLQYGLLGEREIPSEPLRIGEDNGHVLIDMDEIVATREFYREPDPEDPDDDGSRLKVETKKGAKIRSAQAMLKELWSKRAMDPVEFSERLSAKEQLAVLRGLVDLPIDLDALDIEIDEAFDTRTGVGRDVGKLKARVEAYVIGPDWPHEPIDTSRLLTDMQDAVAFNDQIRAGDHLRMVERARIQNARSRAISLRDECERLLRQAAELDETANEGERLLLLDPPLGEPRDVAAIRRQLDEATALNDKHRLRIEFERLEAELAEKVAEHDMLTARIESCRALRDTTIANAKFPVPGLSFGKGEVLFNGLPLDQACSRDRIIVSMGMAIAQNPKLKLIVIKQASLLDEEALEVVNQMAKEHGFVVLGEIVDTTGTVGIYLEAGRVVKVNGTAAKALL